MARAGTTRITADIPNEDIERLDFIQDRAKSNKTTALVRALRTSELLERSVAEGGRIEIVAKDGSRREIVLP